MPTILRLNSDAIDFWGQMKQLLARDRVLDEELEATVRTVLSDIRRDGDAALIRYTNQFENRRVRDVKELFLPVSRLKSAYSSIDAAQRYREHAADMFESLGTEAARGMDSEAFLRNLESTISRAVSGIRRLDLGQDSLRPRPPRGRRPPNP